MLRVKVPATRSSSIVIAGMMNAEAISSRDYQDVQDLQDEIMKILFILPSCLTITQLDEARREFWTRSLILMLEEDVSFFPLLRFDSFDPRF